MELPKGSPCLLLHSTVYLVLKLPTLQGSLSLVYALPRWSGRFENPGRNWEEDTELIMGGGRVWIYLEAGC